MTIITYALTAAALAFAGTIAAELTLPESTPEQAVAVAAPQPMPPATPPPSDYRDQNATRALTALARPLFNQDRRPTVPIPDATPAPLPTSLPRLTGTLVSSAGKRAVFATGDKSAVMAEGSRIDAWTVQAISAGTVTLTGPDGPRVLRLNFAAAELTRQAQAVELPLSLRPARTHSRVIAEVQPRRGPAVIEPLPPAPLRPQSTLLPPLSPPAQQRQDGYSSG